MHVTQQQPSAQSDGPYEKSPRLSEAGKAQSDLASETHKSCKT